MIQDIYQKAMKFAGEKHATQKVPGTTANYLLHIANVAMEILVAYTHQDDFDLALAVQAAILHDTIEDTETQVEEIRTNFGEKVAKAVLALSKNTDLPTKREQMQDSLNRIKQEEKEAGMVKLADRITNLQEPPAYWDLEKTRAYWKEAKLILENLRHTNSYLARRLEGKIADYERFL